MYPCSENKGADKLRGYREADLRLCFRICKKPVFSRCGSYNIKQFERPRPNEVAEQVRNSLCSGMHTHNTLYLVNERKRLLNLSCHHENKSV